MSDTKIVEPYIKNLTFENGLQELQIALEKAEFAIQDVTEDYFSFNDPTGHEVDLTWEYKRGSAKASIVEDYLFVMRRKIDELKEYMMQAEQGGVA